MRRLIRGFAGRTYHIVGNLMSRLNYVLWVSLQRFFSVPAVYLFGSELRTIICNYALLSGGLNIKLIYSHLMSKSVHNICHGDTPESRMVRRGRVFYPIDNLVYSIYSEDKSLAIYFGDSQLRRNRIFSFKI